MLQKNQTNQTKGHLQLVHIPPACTQIGLTFMINIAAKAFAAPLSSLMKFNENDLFTNLRWSGQSFGVHQQC